MKHTNFDWAKFAVKAYVVYSDSDRNVLQECTIHAETVYPLSLMDAITGFRPEFTTTAVINFEYVDGTISVVNYLKF